MKHPSLRLVVTAVFGSAIALSCIAEAVALRIVLPW